MIHTLQYPLVNHCSTIIASVDKLGRMFTYISTTKNRRQLLLYRADFNVSAFISNLYYIISSLLCHI